MFKLTISQTMQLLHSSHFPYPITLTLLSHSFPLFLLPFLFPINFPHFFHLPSAFYSPHHFHLSHHLPRFPKLLPFFFTSPSQLYSQFFSLLLSITACALSSTPLPFSSSCQLGPRYEGQLTRMAEPIPPSGQSSSYSLTTLS